MGPLVVAAFAYVVGSFSTGYYLVRLRTGQDLRTVGSGATGGRNASRVLGPSALVLTMAGDLIKTVVAVGLPVVLGLGPLEVGAAMVGVTAGHIWPIHLGFRGGKGVTPLLGATAIVAPLALAGGAILAGVAILISRRPNLGALAGFAFTPAIALALGAPLLIVAAILIAFVLAAIAHRSNLRQELVATPAPLRLPFIWPGGGSGG